MYSFDFDPRLRLLTVTGEGLWTMATFAAFSAEAIARSAALRLRYGHFAMLNDVRKMPIQTADVTRGLTVLNAKRSRMTTAPIATVVNGTLSKLQVERVLNADNAKAFASIDEAKSWLMARWPIAAA